MSETTDQVPPFPKENCKHCYGRGYVGMNPITKQVHLCRCVIKKKMKDEEGFKVWSDNLMKEMK